MSSTDVCLALKEKFKISSDIALNALNNPSLTHHWFVLRCSKVLELQYPRDTRQNSLKDAFDTTDVSVSTITRDSNEDIELTIKSKPKQQQQQNQQENQQQNDISIAEKCKRMRQKFRVIPGESWGELTETMQK